MFLNFSWKGRRKFCAAPFARHGKSTDPQHIGPALFRFQFPRRKLCKWNTCLSGVHAVGGEYVHILFQLRHAAAQRVDRAA